MEKEVEVWKDIIGLEDYYKISTFGNVFSKRSNKIIKPALLENGYLRVQTKLNGGTVRFRVHRAVAETFVKLKRDDQMFVNHIDGDKQNNHYLNLEWCSLAENQRHARRNGLFKNLYSQGDRKLTPEEVVNIRKMYIKGCGNYGYAGLGEIFGVSKTTICNIVRCKSYSDVT